MPGFDQTLTEFYRAFDPTKDLPADDKRYFPLDDPVDGERLREGPPVRHRQSEFIRSFQEFVTDCISQIRETLQTRGVVFIFDSLEHLQGDVSTAEKVFDSVRLVFSQFPEPLRLPGCHAIYTVPPYLRVLLPGAPGSFAGGDVRLLPMVKLWERDQSRTIFPKGVAALVGLVEKRFDWSRVLGKDRVLLERLILASGGYLRDLFRLLQETTYEVDRLPVGEATVADAIHAVARSYRALADADKTWLRRVRDERSLCLPDVTELRRHAQLFDTHRVFCYRNRDDWYDVHPLVRDWLGIDGSRIL